MESFLALDFETANSDRRSACALGLAQIDNGTLTKSDQFLIKPPDEFCAFNPFNVLLHGITRQDIEYESNFKEVWERVVSFYPLNEYPIVCHNAGFDMRVLRDLLNYFQLSVGQIMFYDTLLFSKQIWPNLTNYKLNNIARRFEINHQHHNAKSDAIACAKIALVHLETLKNETLIQNANNYNFSLGKIQQIDSTSIHNLIQYQTINHKLITKSESQIEIESNRSIDHEVLSSLTELHVVFTGEMSSMTRREATLKAEELGAKVTSSVTGNTNLLIVGTNDFTNYSIGKKSRKIKDAETLMDKGNSIQIIDEEDFIRIITP